MRLLCLLWFIIATVFYTRPVVAQHSLAHAASSFSGLHGAAVNPAQLSFNQRPWGIHLPAAGANFQNNSLVVDRINLLALAFGRTYSFEVDNALNRASNAQAEVFLRANFDNPLDLRLQNWVMGLGGFIQSGRHAFGLSAGARSFLELSRISSAMATQLYEGLRFDSLLNQQISSPGLRLNLMGFSETNLTWSYRILDKRTKAASVGVTAKLMNVQQSAHLALEQFDYTVSSVSDTFLINNLVGTYGRAVGTRGILSGGGLAFDLGFTYVKVDEEAAANRNTSRGIDCFQFRGFKLKKIAPPPMHYWKLGISLLDVGLMRVNSFDFLMAGQNVPIGLREQLFNFSEDPFDATLVDRVDGFGLLVPTNNYTVGAPTALSVQFDYQVLPQFFVNASWMQRMPMFGQYRLGRINQLMVAPRLQTFWAEIGLPLSLIEYRYPQVGLSARLGPVSFGTDRLGELFGLKRVRGLDAYVSVDLFRFWR
ncbi:MAG: DUF5723 family protein [Sphingobacteriaceae bacterium]|nr:DUF5723 family protein [Sphingobacteriaceae bacterium]